jgi:hypothetical protein
VAETQTVVQKPDPQLAQSVADLSAKYDALAKEHADLKAKVSGVEGNVVSMTTEKQTLALLEKARAEVKLTTGNEKVLDPAIRAMAAMDMAKATAFVESLPKLGKGEGSVLHAVGAGTPTTFPPRHRFDVYGPAVWGKSSDPKMHEYGAQMQWASAYEAAAGNPKFKNPSEMLKAFHAANADHARDARVA